MRIIAIILGLALLGSEMVSGAAVTQVRVVLPSQAGAVSENIVRVLARQVSQRCEAKVVTSGEASLVLELAIESDIGAEGFKITDGAGGSVRIIGNDERGLLYGVGKFLRTGRYDEGGFTPGTWRGTSVPQKRSPLRYQKPD